MFSKQVLINCLLAVGLATATSDVTDITTYPQAQAICARQYSFNGAPKVPRVRFLGCTDNPKGFPNPALKSCKPLPTFPPKPTVRRTSASPTSKPTGPPAPFCPGANNKYYISNGGKGRKFVILCGTNTFGTPLATYPGKSLLDCASKCAASRDCVSTTLDRGTCYPKSVKASQSAQVGVDSVNFVN